MKWESTKAGAGPRARRLPVSAPLLCGALLLGITLAAPGFATPGAGVVPEVIAVGDLPAPVRAKFKADGMGGFGSGIDTARIVAIKYTAAPGGFFGWHQHGGPVWVVVMEGTLTLYGSEDRSCAGTVYEAGSAFLDSGTHVHNARNEGAGNVVLYATFMLPVDGQLRIDAPDPMVCPF